MTNCLLYKLTILIWQWMKPWSYFASIQCFSFANFFLKIFFDYIEYYSSINSCPCYQLTLFKNDWIENGTEPMSHFQNSNTWEFLLHVCIVQNVYRMLLFEILKNADIWWVLIIDLIMEESWWRMEGFGVLSFEIMWKPYN